MFKQNAIDRRRRLIEHFMTGKLFSATQLSQMEHVTKNSIERDITVLRNRGYQIEGARGSGGGYMMRSKSLLWPAGSDEDGD